MKKIEYKYIPKKFPGLSLEELNNLGEEGWIMCGSEHLKEPDMIDGEYDIVGKIYVFYRQVETKHFYIKFENNECTCLLARHDNNANFIILTENPLNPNIIKFDSIYEAESYLKYFINERETYEQFVDKLAYKLRSSGIIAIVKCDDLTTNLKSYVISSVDTHK